MKIIDVKTYLTGQAWPDREGIRNFLFVRIYTDEGITGIGEASSLPAIEAEIRSKGALIIGEDPFQIQKLWSKMYLQSHFMTGIASGGAISAIEMALWDIKGKALGQPIWNLLGGKMRDEVRAYTHADTPEQARFFVDQGYTGLKMGGTEQAVQRVKNMREEVGDDIDIMADLHGPPWMTTADAISIGKAIEDYGLLFYEEPVAPENVEALARVQNAVNIPLASGERLAYIYAARELIEREIVDIIQPDAGRFGGLSQMMKLAAMAEAHYIQMAPHDGSLGPVGEMASIHLCASIPNFLIWEHRTGDVPLRYEVMQPQPEVVDSHIVVPNLPGLGVDLIDEVIVANPGDFTPGGHATNKQYGYRFVYPQPRRANWLKGKIQ